MSTDSIETGLMSRNVQEVCPAWLHSLLWEKVVLCGKSCHVTCIFRATDGRFRVRLDFRYSGTSVTYTVRPPVTAAVADSVLALQW